MTQKVPQVGDVWEFRCRRVLIDSVIGECVYYMDEFGELRAVNLRHFFSVPKLIERDGKAVGE